MSLLLKSAALVLMALVIGGFLFAVPQVDARAPAPPFDLLFTNVVNRATFDNPHQFPIGIKYVLVNGAPVLADNQITEARAGVALRGPGYQLPQEAQKAQTIELF